MLIGVYLRSSAAICFSPQPRAREADEAITFDPLKP
jgi:hypothetical protein